MHIGHFYRDYLVSGGIPSNCRALTIHTARLGHQISIYTFLPARVDERQDVPDIVHVKTFDCFSHIPFRIPTELSTILRTNADGLDILHIHGVYLPENIVVARKAKSGGIPYIVSPDGSLNPIVIAQHRVKKNLYKVLFARHFLNQAVGVHALSNTEVKQVRQYGVSTPTFIAPVGVFQEELPTVSIERNYLDTHFPDLVGKQKLVYLGRLDIFQKGLDLLVKGFAEAIRRHPELDLVLAFIGPDWKGGQAKINSLAHRLTITDRVRLLEPIYGEDKFLALANADLLVHPARWEELPRSVREALAIGCPVMVTPETNLAELVEQYKAGIVVQLNSESIAGGIIEVFRNSNQLQLMRNNARTLANEELNWTKISHTICQAYEDLLQGKQL